MIEKNYIRINSATLSIKCNLRRADFDDGIAFIFDPYTDNAQGLINFKECKLKYTGIGRLEGVKTYEIVQINS